MHKNIGSYNYVGILQSLESIALLLFGCDWQRGRDNNVGDILSMFYDPYVLGESRS